MTTGVFKYINSSSYDPNATEPLKKPWKKVDGPDSLFKLLEKTRFVRGQETQFSVDSRFAVYSSPSKEKDFTEKSVIMTNYYAGIEALLRAKLSGVKKVAIFDHTIRRREKGSPRAPVQLVHVDQTPYAAELRVNGHLPPDKAERLLQGRYQIISLATNPEPRVRYSLGGHRLAIYQSVRFCQG